jgi:hypothetical protein
MSMNPITQISSLLQPDIFEGQIGGAANGAGASVNKFRGDVIVPLPIACLPGFQDIAIALTAVNASNVFRTAKRNNAQAPTSILGLGWSLPRERIVVLGKRSTDIRSGGYSVENNGKLFALTLIEHLGSDYLFVTNALPLWQFLYNPADELWTVTTPDGGKRRYGGRTIEGACEWGLSWNGWIGASIAPGSTPYVLAWNLVRIANAWGVGLTHTYTCDTLSVGSSASYTRANYLTVVTDDLGQAVELRYAEKDPFEYVCPHVHSGKPYTAYQHRYETRFLQSVVEYSNWSSRIVARTIEFEYGFCNLVDAARSTYTKRILLAIQPATNGIRDPATCFSYNTDPQTAAPGALTSILNPSGAVFRYQYKAIQLNAQDSPYFNKSLTIAPPAGLEGARPYLLPSETYLALTWLQATRGTVAVQIYNFGGAWSTPWSPPPIRGAFDPDGVVYAQIENYLALFLPPISGGAGNSAQLLLFRRDPYRLDTWHMERRDIRLTANAQKVRASLIGGDEFFSLAIAGQGRFQIFDFNPETLVWTETSFTPGGENVVVATDGTRILAGSVTVSRSTLSLRLYSRALDRSWSMTGGPIDKTGVTWNDNYVGSLLNCGPNFGTATYVDGSGGQVSLLTWNGDGKFDSERSYPATTAYTRVSQSIVINGPRVFRYDAGVWKPFTFDDNPYASYAVGDDFALRTLPVGAPAVTLIRYQPDTGTWTGTSLPGANAALYPPTLAGDIMTCGTKVYRRQPDDTWHQIAELPTSGDPATLVNRGTYVIYQLNLPNGDRRVIVLLLAEEGKVDTVGFDGQKFGGDTAWFIAAACASLRAFVTYPKTSHPWHPNRLC